MTRSRIKIPDKHFVGTIKSMGDEYPVGLMTEWGEDRKSVSRVKTITEHLNSYTGRHYAQVLSHGSVIDNKPLSGFKLTGYFSTGSYKTYDRFSVLDPRGFEVEITSGNLQHILTHALIRNGEILDECRWCRNGGNNVLLLTSSDEYSVAMSNTIAANQSDDWKNVKLGDTVLLQNNIQGTYLGRMYPVVRGFNTERKGTVGSDEIIGLDLKYYVIHVNEPTGFANEKSFMLLSKKPKLSKIVSSSKELTLHECEIQANLHLTDSTCATYCGQYGCVLSLSFDPIQSKKLIKVPMDNIKSVIDMQIAFSENQNVLFLKSSSVKGLFGRLSCFGTYKCGLYKESYLKKGELRRVLEIDNQSGDRTSLEKSVEYQFDKNDEFFYLRFQSKTSLGTSICYDL